MITRLDHLVILVRDLERAVSDYGRLGFGVTLGGEHADGLTRNALIPFQDGSYLELVAFAAPSDSRDNFWGWRSFLATGGGLIDHCAASDDLENEAERLRALGLAVEGPDEGGRRLPDGVEIRWKNARIRQSGRTLPFLIEDLAPRELRVPGGSATEHPNGATGVSRLTIAAPEPARAAELYAAALTGEASREDNRKLSVQLGDCEVCFPVSDPETVQRLDAAGPGPFSVDLVRGNSEIAELDRELTHGVRIRFASSIG